MGLDLRLHCWAKAPCRMVLGLQQLSRLRSPEPSSTCFKTHVMWKFQEAGGFGDPYASPFFCLGWNEMQASDFGKLPKHCLTLIPVLIWASSHITLIGCPMKKTPPTPKTPIELKGGLRRGFLNKGVMSTISCCILTHYTVLYHTMLVYTALYFGPPKQEAPINPNYASNSALFLCVMAPRAWAHSREHSRAA